MYCPRCGATQSEDLNFCKSCGANLLAVRRAVEARDVDEEPFNWDQTGVGGILSPEGQAKRKAEMDLRRSIISEAKRYKEIKAGVIVSSLGIALMVFLSIFMGSIAEGGKVPADTASILNHLWVAGVIPFFIGLALMLNGIVISKRLIEIEKKRLSEVGSLADKQPHAALRSADPSEFVPTDFSVTEHTTKHLGTVRDRD